jgi:undecaprenyl-diphosphatase
MRVVRRRWGDVVGLVIGLAVFLGSAAVADRGVMWGEIGLFEAVNSLPDVFYVVIWPFMQYGVFVTIPVLTVVALLFRRFRLAIAMAVAGVGVYFLARLVKEVVVRQRPEAFVPDVQDREVFAAESLGYPSGHAAVAGALTMVVTPYLRGRWKLVPASLLVIVLFGRMYVGAHLPLDLIGGAALGVVAGSFANLVVGVPVGDAEKQVDGGADRDSQPAPGDDV